MHPALDRKSRRLAKTVLERALPPIERIAGFQTARGDYLPNRLKILIGRYEAKEIKLMRRFLKPGQVIVDVGANVGYLTRFFARATGSTGKVYAFEPNPTVFALLQKNLSRFPQVSPHNVGLSLRDERLPLFLAGSDHSVASFVQKYPEIHVFYQESGKIGSTVSDLVAGDNFMRKIGVHRVDVLKVDVEGWELNVLNGLEQTIRNSRQLTIFCEFNPQAQSCAGRGKLELFDWFFDRQFSLLSADGNDLRPLSRESAVTWIDNHNPSGFSTLFAVRA